ncbi:MAG TPA: thioredoxin [Candidatus Vogelbacteria bacterium]|nr:thioredoxin [Candidatus Vogelbacteria bacterium]
MRKFIFTFIILLTFGFLGTIVQAQENEVIVYFFKDESCPYCLEQKKFLDELKTEFTSLDVREIRVFDDDKNIDLFLSFIKNYDIKFSGVPTTFIGDFSPIIGFDIKSADKIREQVLYCLDNVCPDPAIKAGVEDFFVHSAREVRTVYNLPFWGDYDFAETPLVVMTLIISFVDGFNPCSLWLISFLLAIVVYTRSRKKVLLVGFTFLFVTSLAYGLFIAGLLNIFYYVGYLRWIQILVALIAFLFGAVNVKDYFWYKKGLSFTIPDSYKPKIFKDIRSLVKQESSWLALMIGTTLMALGVVLVELPCTAGFPMVWSNLVGRHQLPFIFYICLLTIYLLVYLSIEMSVIIVAVLTMNIGRFQEKHGRILKLIGGVIMLALAGVMVWQPKLMSDIKGTITLFAVAILVSLVIILLDRLIRPKNEMIIDNNINQE